MARLIVLLVWLLFASLALARGGSVVFYIPVGADDVLYYSASAGVVGQSDFDIIGQAFVKSSNKTLAYSQSSNALGITIGSITNLQGSGSLSGLIWQNFVFATMVKAPLSWYPQGSLVAAQGFRGPVLVAQFVDPGSRV